MRKSNEKIVIAILTADWHLRDSIPICRTDKFEETQWRKVRFVSEIQKKYDCIVLHAGDLFHHWKPSPYLLSQTIKYLPKKFYTVYGNHDLPQHNLNLKEKSGIYTLEVSGILKTLPYFHYGEALERKEKDSKIIVMHKMVYQSELPWPGCNDYKAIDLIKKWREINGEGTRIIVTGDNHKSFVVEDKDTVLVNPGSLTRQTADQANHQPCIYILYSDYTVEKIYIPIRKEAVTNSYITKKREDLEGIKVFVESLNQEWNGEMDFERELEYFFSKNNTPLEIREIIYNSLEYE
mgnify:CR=1 FL=1